jgi:glycosyltransferase involved in cell wall biosynthesis
MALFALTFLVQLIYYLFVYLRVVLKKSSNKQHVVTDSLDLPTVSVVICAQNEEDNLSENLIQILEQNYPVFEVIVVNCCSEDNTEQLLAELKQQYPHLRSTIIKRNGSFVNFKKFAATVGVKAAQYEWILFTDANCVPQSPDWIASMSEHFVPQKSIVLGYGGYSLQKGFSNKWIRYDNVFNALQCFGFAMIRKAYTAMERNLAFRRSLFFEHKGFPEHAHIISGNNDMFVNKAAKGRNVAVAKDDNSQTRTTYKMTFSGWMWHKRQQIMSRAYYKHGQVFFLTLEPLSRILLWSAFIWLMVFNPLWQYVLAVFMLRMILFTSITAVAVKRFKEPRLMFYAIFFDMIMPLMYMYLYVISKISSKHRKWNLK